MDALHARTVRRCSSHVPAGLRSLKRRMEAGSVALPGCSSVRGVTQQSMPMFSDTCFDPQAEEGNASNASK